MDQPVSSLCTGKFASLKQYISDSVTVEDLKALDDPEDTLVADVEQKDKLLMRVFYAQHLQPLLDVPDPFDESDPSVTVLSAPLLIVAGRLNLRDRLISSKFKDSAKGLPAYLIVTDSLPDKIKSMGKEKIEQIKIIDVSRNNLTDEDFEPIYNMATELPNCEEVDLSVNRIQGRSREWLLKILHLGHLKWVNVVMNTLASVECKDFFQQLKKREKDEKGKEIFTKLIWIPDNWLKGGGWRTIIDDKKFEEDIVAAHNAYYNVKSSNHDLFQ